MLGGCCEAGLLGLRILWGEWCREVIWGLFGLGGEVWLLLCFDDIEVYCVLLLLLLFFIFSSYC